jgi:hypothetical protein
VVPIVMSVPWLWQSPWHVNDPISRLKMSPIALSMVLPRGLGLSIPRKPSIEHLTGDEYCPQPLTNPCGREGRQKV